MKRPCLGDRGCAVIQIGHQLRQTLIQTFTFMLIYVRTRAFGAHRCPQMIKTSFLLLSK